MSHHSTLVWAAAHHLEPESWSNHAAEGHGIDAALTIRLEGMLSVEAVV